MQSFLCTLTDWTLENDMRINTSKTKELVIEPWGQHNATLLQIESGAVERVRDFKLLGVYVDSTLSWTKHVEYIAQKATKRLYFLKVLKRAGLPPDQLLHYYVAVIRPVLEYCSCIWHHNITNKLSLHIEAIQ